MVYSVAIAGASGYVGGELLRLLANHPEFEVRTLTANSNVGERVGSLHPHLSQFAERIFASTDADTLVHVNFTPVLVPMARGILSVNTAKLVGGVTAEQVRAAWANAYEGETFVRLLPEGEYPSTSSTLGVNTALIGLTIDEHAGRVIVVCAIDNLVKGTAGAAIQSLNIALGIAEPTGLGLNGVAP